MGAVIQCGTDCQAFSLGGGTQQGRAPWWRVNRYDHWIHVHEESVTLYQELWAQMVALEFSCSPEKFLLIWWSCLLRAGRKACNTELRAFLDFKERL
jgi:hypothetical protein